MKPGDRIVYVLMRSVRDGRPQDLRFPGVVLNIGPSRISIRLDRDGPKSHRSVSPKAIELAHVQQ